MLPTTRTSRLGKYEIVDELGHGGMATVYRARDTRLDRMVALKVMHPHLHGAKDARARFAREAVTIARLKHPNILEIYDYSGEDGDSLYIATELLTGPTLKQLVELHPDMPAEIAACIVVLVARALGAAHAEGVTHRDVKPENVMMHEDRAVKLTDFGIAQLVDMQGMTSTGEVLGSPAHMAPEQVEGKDTDARTDIFSLGTVLYMLATGELPFSGRNPHQVLKQIVDGQFRDPLRVKPQIGARLRNIIMRCLQVDPAQRYASATALEGDLMAFVRTAGIDDPNDVIARYLQGTHAFSVTFRTRIIEAEMTLGERAMKDGDLPRAMDAFNRVLAIDEHNDRVLSLVANLGKRQKIRRVAYWAMLVVSLACVTAVLVHAAVTRGPSAGHEADHAQKPAPADKPPAVTTQPVVEPAPSAQASAPGTGVRPGQDHRGNAARPATARTDEGVPAVDSAGPRHVVLRPEPANVSIGIDGAAPREFGPSFRSVSLSPGSHVFAFKGAHDCCVDEQVTLDIPPGAATFVVAHKLRFRPAVLQVASNAPADVQIDRGAVRGRTWSLIQVPQPNELFATHALRVSAEGYTDAMLDVRLRAGQIERIEVTLEKVGEPAKPGSASATQ